MNFIIIIISSSAQGISDTEGEDTRN